MGRQRFFGNKGHGVIFIGGAATHDLADGDLINIGNKTYEIDEAADGVTAGNIAVDTSGDTTAAQAVATIVGVINANKPSVPVTALAHPGDSDHILITADARAAAGNMVFTATFSATSTITGSGLLQFGEDGGSQVESRVEYIAEAEDVSATMIVIETGMNSPRFADVTVRDAGGAVVAWDGDLVVSGSQIRIDNGGAVDWVDGSVLTVTYWE